MQVDFEPATVHERALASPAQWAALSERMLRVQEQMPRDAALGHLGAVAAAAPAAFQVDLRRGVTGEHAHQADVRKLTGTGDVSSSAKHSARTRMMWFLRHLRAFAEAFPCELLTAPDSADQPVPPATPKHLRSLWLVRLQLVNMYHAQARRQDSVELH